MSNQLPKGYKLTEVGVIPADWNVKPLKGKVSISHGFPFSSQYFSSNGNFRRTTPGHFYEEGGFKDIGDKQKFYIGAIPDDYVLQPGDLIVAMTEQSDGLLGSAAFIPNINGYLHNQRLGRVRAISSEFSLNYLYWVFNSASYRIKVRETAAGTKVKHTSPNKLLEIYIPLPSLSEQKAIAEVLSDIDALLNSLERLIAKKQDIKQATMQELLTGKTRLFGFGKGKSYKQTEIGTIPEDWNLKLLPEVAWFQEGPGLRNWQFTNRGIKVINVTNLENGFLNLETTDRYISFEEFLKTYSHFSIDNNDIVIASSGNSYCKVAVVREQDLPLLMNTSVIRFKAINDYDYNFLLAYLKSKFFKSQIDLMITGGAQPNFGPYHLKKIYVPVPQCEEQKAIAEVLSNMDAEIAALEKRYEKTKALKQGMMQELLTGKTRLINN